uniref:Capsid protein n=1 Tax=Erysiphe necator associated sobemo-like virus 1 TaxID=2743137 RepID=A0A8E3YXM3_9VIRU|nr:coat protein [Erysiphe necator associated sobemo-like virus 1]
MTTGSSVPLKSKQKKRRTRRRKQQTSVGTMGEVTLARRELAATVKLNVSEQSANGAIHIVPDSFTFLKGIGKSFDRFRWSKIHFFYKPAVGTTYGGLVSIGIDWDSQAGVQDRQQISALTPNRAFSAWSDTEKSPLVLPTNRLQSREWYLPHRENADDIDKGPGILKWAVDGEKTTTGKTIGEIWVDYSVSMSGTNSS